VFCTVDLAISQKQTADYFVCQVWALTPGGHMLLLDQVRGRYEAPQQVGILWEIRQKYRPYAIWIESTGFQLSLIQTLRWEGMAEAEEFKSKGDKRERAAVAAKLLALGRVYFRDDAPYLPELEDEVTSFPLGEHDDQTDAMAFAAILVDSQQVTPSAEDPYAILEERAKREKLRRMVQGHSGDRPPTPEEWLAANTPDRGHYSVNRAAARGWAPFGKSPWGEIPQHFRLPSTDPYRFGL
jgi:predicted phage terminase large subunit-like protein